MSAPDQAKDYETARMPDWLVSGLKTGKGMASGFVSRRDIVVLTDGSAYLKSGKALGKAVRSGELGCFVEPTTEDCYRLTLLGCSTYEADRTWEALECLPADAAYLRIIHIVVERYWMKLPGEDWEEIDPYEWGEAAQHLDDYSYRIGRPNEVSFNLVELEEEIPVEYKSTLVGVLSRP